MFQFSKFFIVALFSILLVGIFSFGLVQHNNTSNGNPDHSQHNEHNQKSSDPMNINDHQHKSMSEVPIEDDVDIKFTLAASFFEGKWIFVGDSSNINGQINPVLEVPQGAVAEITLLNYTIWQHNFVIPDLALHSEHVDSGDAVTFTFRADLESGVSYPYYCTVDNHNQQGMEGLIVIK